MPRAALRIKLGNKSRPMTRRVLRDALKLRRNVLDTAMHWASKLIGQRAKTSWPLWYPDIMAANEIGHPLRITLYKTVNKSLTAQAVSQA